MKKLLWLIVAALVGYGVWDIVRTVREGYTTTFSRTYAQAAGQMMSHAFDSLDLRGRGVKIGVLDAGFGGFRTHRFTRGLQVGGYRDFTGGDTAAFFDDPQDHGSRVCANIGGFSGDTLRGLATQSIYFLAKTDDAEREPRAEERLFIRGVEWLLAQGIDVISSSLAYTVFDDFQGYDTTMLDGRSSVLSHYLDSLLAARPDLIFVQSAGNEGDERWHYISFPGDVQGVITVGAADGEGWRDHSSGVGRENQPYIKPDFALPASPPGTSFSTPLITGLCACMLEYRRIARVPMIDYLHRSATHASSPDRATGYGVPQTGELLKLLEP